MSPSSKTQNQNKEENRKIFCRICKQATNHKVLFKVQKKDSWDNEDGMWTVSTFYTLQCQGCEAVCLLEEYVFSEDYNPQTGELDVVTTIYPSPHETKTPIEDYYYIPKIVARIYKECVIAFNKKLPILTSIGMRAVIEAICKDKEVVAGGLEKKIDALAKMGLMTEQEAELLHLNRYMGNASAHELQEPLEEELNTGLDIIETTLRNAYILSEKAQILRNKYTKSLPNKSK